MTTTIRKPAIVALALGFASLAAAQDQKAPAKTTRTLKVSLSYTGAGKVDDKHRIFVFLFDTPDFMQGNGAPIDSKAVSEKNAAATFAEITVSPVYVAVVFDPTGGYDGQSPPPSGSSAGLYSKTPGVPEPIKIEAGGTAEVEVAFGDEGKIP